jgi:hypothetical protein
MFAASFSLVASEAKLKTRKSKGTAYHSKFQDAQLLLERGAEKFTTPLSRMECGVPAISCKITLPATSSKAAESKLFLPGGRHCRSDESALIEMTSLDKIDP